MEKKLNLKTRTRSHTYSVTPDFPLFWKKVVMITNQKLRNDEKTHSKCLGCHI